MESYFVGMKGKVIFPFQGLDLLIQRTSLSQWFATVPLASYKLTLHWRPRLPWYPIKNIVSKLFDFSIILCHHHSFMSPTTYVVVWPNIILCSKILSYLHWCLKNNKIPILSGSLWRNSKQAKETYRLLKLKFLLFFFSSSAQITVQCFPCELFLWYLLIPDSDVSLQDFFVPILADNNPLQLFIWR